MIRILIMALCTCLITTQQLTPSQATAKQELGDKESQAEGISFRDYYRDHKDEVDEAIATRSLDLEGQNLKDLIDFDVQHIPGLGRLVSLDLSDNELTTLSDKAFSGLKKLKSLYLQGNRLTALPDHIFSDLTTLEHLFLSGNQLSALPNGIFSSLAKLQSLELYRNKLIDLPADIFSDLTKLQSLELFDNQLTALPPTIFSGLTALHTLGLYNNPIPLTQEQLSKELQLSDTVELEFKTAEQEKIEKELINALRAGTVDAVRDAYNAIREPRLNLALASNVDFTKIRTPNGNNLLHELINAATSRRSAINKRPELTASQRATQLVANEKRYAKIFTILTDKGGPDEVQDMLLTRNKSGDDVIASAIATFGRDSALVRTIFSMTEYEPTPAGKHAPLFPIKTRGPKETDEAALVAREQAEQKQRLEQEKVVAKQQRRPESMPTEDPC